MRIKPETGAELALSLWFGIDAGSAQVLNLLLAANGDPISLEAFKARHGISVACIRYRIWDLRAAMRCEAIDTTPGGYALTAIGLSECRAALYQMAAEIASVAAPPVMIEAAEAPLMAA